MSKRSKLIFCLLVSIALSLPIYESFVASNDVAEADMIASAHPLTLNARLGDFVLIKKSDQKEVNVLHYIYASPSGQPVAVVVRQASIYRPLHELFFCLSQLGWSMEKLGKVRVGSEPCPIDAQLLRVRVSKASSLALLWYQWPGGCATFGDWNFWRIARVQGAVQHRIPLIREVEVATYAPERPEDVAVMSKLASLVAQQPF